MIEVKEILKEKVMKDIESGTGKLSSNTVEFIKNNFYIWFAGEASIIYDMFSVVRSFNTNKGFRIKMSIDFLNSDRRRFIASNVFNYLDYMNYEEAIRNVVDTDNLEFLNRLDKDRKKEIIFIFDPTSTVNCEKVRLDLTLKKGDKDGK